MGVQSSVAEINGEALWGPRALLGGFLGVLGSLMGQCRGLGLTVWLPRSQGLTEGILAFPKVGPPDPWTTPSPRPPLGTSTCGGDNGDAVNGDSGPGGAPSFSWRGVAAGRDGRAGTEPPYGWGTPERRHCCRSPAQGGRAGRGPSAPCRRLTQPSCCRPCSPRPASARWPCPRTGSWTSVAGRRPRPSGCAAPVSRSRSASA